MKKKLWTILATAMMALPLFAGASSVKADDAISETMANVTINKRVFDEGKTPANIQNTGEKMEFGGTALNGSEFTVYDVTSHYLTLLTGSSQSDAIKKIQEDAKSTAPSYATFIDVKTTAGEGQAIFENLPLKNSDGKYKVYLFLETKTPNTTTVTKLATPIVLAMPIYKLDSNNNKTDVLNTDIQLYPKNETAKDTKELTNAGSFAEATINGTTYKNVTTGDTLNYALTVNIPGNIGDSNAVKSFVIKDTPSTGLALVNGTIKVGSLVENTDYTITYANGGFTVLLKLDSQNVKALAGIKLQLTYDMKLTATVEPDKLQSNQASVKINDGAEQEITPPKSVGTGGYRFTKIDSQTKETLSGAEFVVANSDQTKFATFADTKNSKGEYVFSGWVDTKEKATTLTSDDKGSVKVIGLLNGDYILNETKTPNSNYVKLADGTIKFTVSHGSYSSSELNVPNTPKGLLPSTGGKGIYAFLAIGAALMVGAAIWYKKSKDTAEV